LSIFLIERPPLPERIRRSSANLIDLAAETHLLSCVMNPPDPWPNWPRDMRRRPMTLEEIFNIARRERFLVVSTVNESGAPEGALMGFALTQANEIVFDTLASSRKAANLARNDAAALVIGWEDGISLQMEGVARRPAGEDLANAKEAYFRQWPDGRARENWPDIAYIVVHPKWIRYSNYSGVPVIEEFKL
jgi:general stress protein 26